MTRALVRFYTVSAMTCEVTLPDGVTAEEAEHHLLANCNATDPQPIPYLPAIYEAMNTTADTVDSWVDWEDTEGITITAILEE